MMTNNVFQVVAVNNQDTYYNAAGEQCRRVQVVLQALDAPESQNPNRRFNAVVATVFNPMLELCVGDVVAATLRYTAKQFGDTWFQDVTLSKVVKLLTDNR